MSKYKNIINPFTGILQKVFSGDLVTFKAGVASVGNLPTEGNEKGDGRIVNDTGNLYIWDGNAWQDQGDIIDLKWASIENKPSSSVANIDDAVAKKHIRSQSIVDSSDHSDKVDYVDIPYSSTILTGGILSEGTNVGTLKVSALTALIRTGTSSTDALKKITLIEQDNQVIASTYVLYYVILDYNADSPQIVIQEAEPNNNNQIQIGRVLKNFNNNIHWRNSGLRFAQGIQQTNERIRALREWEFSSIINIADKGTKQFSVSAGSFFRGVSEIPFFIRPLSLVNPHSIKSLSSPVYLSKTLFYFLSGIGMSVAF